MRERMEAHPAVPPKEDGAAHSLVGNNIHPYGKGSRRSTIIVALHGYPSLSAGKRPMEAEPAP